MCNLLRPLAAVLLLAACDMPTTSAPPMETSLAFSYRLGDGAWQDFSASGQQADHTPFATLGPWVYTGSAGVPHTRLIIAAHQQVGGGWITLHTFPASLAGVDSIAFGEVGGCPVDAPCSQAWLYFRDASGVQTEMCSLSAGWMVNTRWDGEWAAGRFRGTGTCTATGGAQRPIEIRSGGFQLALPPPVAAPG